MEHILVIEDSPSMGRLLSSKITECHKLPVIVAESCHDAKQAIKRHRSSIFLAIVDINLPDAPNGEAVDAVLDEHIPAIVFTGSMDDALREKILSKGVSDYVLKHASHSLEYILNAVHRIYLNQSTKVLVVDDAKSFRDMMASYLERQCFNVIVASGGQQALKLLEEHKAVELSIIDCYMDGMDGFDLVRKIRESYSSEQMSIIGVSSKANETETARFLKNGANDFIHKPFLPEEFTYRANLCIDRISNIKALKAANAKKNQLIGMVAHDIRGPLGSVVAVAKMMKDGELSLSKQKKMLSLIIENSEEMLSMVNELLDMSVLDSGQFEIKPAVCDFTALTQDVVAIYRDAARNKSIKLEVSVPELLPTYIDQGRMKQVLSNLISNAIKYSPGNTTVKVVLDSNESLLTMHIKDEGVGIQEKEEALLFKAFTKLSSKTTAGESSTGLGLAICKKIVDAHSGTIGYRRRNPCGSDFHLTIPRDLRAIPKEVKPLVLADVDS